MNPRIRTTLLCFALCFAVVSTCATATFAQGTLHLFPGSHAGELQGGAVADVGDVDHDGFPDFVVGAKLGRNPGGVAVGTAVVYSGVDESVIYSLYGKNYSDFFGVSVSSAGDVNNDGVPDVIVGAPREDVSTVDNGSAQVFSGLDGSLLYTWAGERSYIEYGLSVRDAGDVNNDGFPDVVVGAWRDYVNGPNSGSADVYSGANGLRLYQWFGDAAGDELAFSVSGAGDTNNDGYDDIIVATLDDDNTVLDAGGARLFSGLDGAILHQWDGDSTADWYGYAVIGVGDLDGDGHDDVMVGAPRDDNNGDDSGMIRCFSGADYSMLIQADGSIKSRFGWSVADASDVNGDGVPDLIVGAPWWSSQNGRVHVLSGVDGSSLHTLYGPAYSNFGFYVSSARDANRDTVPDVFVGAPYDKTHGINAGSAHVISVVCGNATPYGAGCAGSGGFVPAISISGCPTQGGDVTFTLANALGGTFGVMFFGIGQETLATGIGCPLVNAPLLPPVVVVGIPGSGPGTGMIQATGTVFPNLIGTITVNLQILIADPEGPGGYATSNGLELKVL